MSAVENPTTQQNAPRKRPTVTKPLPLFAVSTISISALLLAWWLATRFNIIEPLFLPAPGAVLRRFWQLVTVGYMDATLWHHLSASLQRIGLALLAALLTAIPLGVAIGRSRIARGVFDPLIEFYRPIPPLAYLPLIVIWFGIGEFSKVLLIYLAILAPIVIATADGVRSADPARILAAQTLGATPLQLIRYVIFPGALPDILVGVRIGLGVGWSTLVAAELVAATQGLGFMVQAASQFLVTEVVILGILVIASIAFVMEIGLRYLQRKLTPWHGRTP
ncbi:MULTISPECIES: taurine ABC transporter permease TauC [unclassified Brenneria]|uniref:taurine ABC transporter permease TauC n=1 Tax=unclassified Brenneria TaxID=2634434 RepID=UPI0015564F5C|nr:taurine ABC transporter permease TauC [Brenneria sp. hezel4-2-4]MEE3651057.1 taurine ABC transporter permease TauC [Brenneria sp. HEZEL_4_2_4]NPD01012.1 taurine ABC transporter permease TauC [Brenneria sp. hezel4-2-4]